MLTSKNRFAIAMRQSANRDMSLVEALQEVLDNLPKRGRGRARSNGRHTVAVRLAHLLRAQGYSLSSTKEKPFVILLGVVFSVALGKHVEALHKIAERALKVQAEFSNGLMVIPPRP